MKPLSKLFAATQPKAPAAENMIDEALKANQAADSADPAVQQSAVDFDAELAALNAQVKAENPAPTDFGGGELDAGGDDTSGTLDTGDSFGDTGGESSSEDPPAEDPDTKDNEDADEAVDPEDPAAEAEPLPNDGDLQKAAEAIGRLSRCLQSLDNAHETGQVSPVMATAAHGIADTAAVELDLDIPSAPALESISGASANARFQEVRQKVVATLKAAWERFMGWMRQVVRWGREFKRAYDARRGTYDKTAAGYAARLNALKGQLTGGVTVEFKSVQNDVKLGVLQHESRFAGVDRVVEAGTLLSTVAQTVALVCGNSSLHDEVSGLPKLYIKMSERSVADGIADFSGLNIPRILKASPSSDVISAAHPSLTHVYEPADDDKPGTLAVGGIPGGLTLQWSFGHHEHFDSIAAAVKATSFARFAALTDKAEGSETLEIDIDGALKLLNLYGVMMKANATLLKSLSFIEQNYGRLEKFGRELTAIMTKTNTEANHSVDEGITPQDMQDLVRLYTLMIAGYERTMAAPVHVLVRAQSNAQESVLRYVGAALVEMDGQLKKATAA